MKNDGKRLIFPVRELDLAHFEKNKAINYTSTCRTRFPRAALNRAAPSVR